MDLNLTPELSCYPTITLEEMGKVRLMNRTDTKYVVPLSTVRSMLQLAKDDYLVQVVQGEMWPLYRTVYLDTPDYDMYTAHQRGKLVREKIRVRTYDVSGISFLEVKNKNNHGRTKKKRISVQGRHSLAADGGDDFLHSCAWYSLADLQFHLENAFRRVTLVNRAMTERLTIDFDLGFNNLISGQTGALPGVAIVELKRDGRTYSRMEHILRQLRAKPMGFSKYCVGAALTNSQLKQGRFKKKLRMARRMAME